jgi:signal peptidase I
MVLRWFSSRSVRQALDLCHRVEKLAKAQRDILSSQAAQAIAQAVDDVRNAIRAGADNTAVDGRAGNLETVANKWLKPYPHAAIRENVDVFLVALVIALGIRTFFLQPMAIPTGSMQPTLFGITHQDLRGQPSAEIPRGLTRAFQSLVRGISYYHVTAVEDGVLEHIGEPQMVFPFVKKQRLIVGGRTYTIWFPPDKLDERSGLHGREGERFRKGDDIIKLKVMSGDRLFVDRFTVNFRRPSRGEIIIFLTEGIERLQQDTHYIKRLVALGGERVQINNQRHLVIDGKELDASTPRFENVYSFRGPPAESQYSGHVNTHVAARFGMPNLAQRFPNEETPFQVRPRHYLVMGDNTMNSFDSRDWGDFPREKVIGKFAFVFWPISSRFGWAVR